MSDWRQWCRLCAELEATVEVDEDVKQTAFSVFEISNISNLDELYLCLNCINFIQELMNLSLKAQKVNEMFDDINSRDIELSGEELLDVREDHLNPPKMDPEEIEFARVEMLDEEEIAIQFTEEYLEPPEEQEVTYSQIQGTSEEKFKCERCEKVYQIKSHFDTHLKTCRNFEDPTRKFSCKICSKRFKEGRHLSTHMNTHLSDDQRTEYPCGICGKNYSSVFSLRQHHKVVHVGTLAFECIYCNKKFSRKANLESHLLVHSSDKPFECEICGLKLKSKGNLRVHKKIHSDDFVSCQTCGKQFKTLNQLTNHKVTHTSEKKFSCDKCHASYKRSKELQNHLMAVHFNIRKYACPWCSKTFVNGSNFRKHKKVVHPKELVEYEKELKDDKLVEEEEIIYEEIDENFLSNAS